MAPILITRREAAELGGISETTVKKAVDQRVIPSPRRGAQSCVEVEDVPVLAMLGLLSEMRLAVRHKRRVREWLRTSGGPSELELAPAVVLRRVGAVDEAGERAGRYARLRDRWIVSDPDVKGGTR